jgi:hypothetical protein
MPFSIRFRKPVDVTEAEPYINDCCIGGDVVLEHLLPALRQTYGDLEPTQEDWGWFVWFEHVGVKLAVDVFTQDPLTNEFEIHLTSRKARLLRSARVVDTPELEALRRRVVSSLEAWPVTSLIVERLDEKHMPIP